MSTTDSSSRKHGNRRRRVSIMGIAVFVLVAVFVVRLVDIQVVQASTLNTEAVGRRSVDMTLYGDRGQILDANGKVLAGTVVRYDITATPKFAQEGYAVYDKKKRKTTYSLHQAVDQIAKAIGGDAATMYGQMTADKTSLYVKLASGVDIAAYTRLKALNIPWIYPVRQSARTYPDGSVAGNLVGFVGTSGAQAGLEYKYDKCLSGQNGVLTYERGGDGVQLPGSTVTTKAPVNGGTLLTTIDSDLQYQVEQDLKEQASAVGATSATAVVMRVSDAALVAVADTDAVDPNQVGATPDADRYSKAFTDSYEPGSTFKAMVAAALIDSGKATPTSGATVPSRRTFPWGGMIADAEPHPVERLTLAGILADSSNVGISLLGEQLSPQQRYDYMLKFGLGKPSEVGFPGESSGQLQPASKWDKQTDINSMFGQGVGATAIQTASIFQTLANGGVRMPVKLVTGCKTSDGKIIDAPSDKGTRVVSAKAANDVVAMLENTIPEGTLKGLAPLSGYNVATKTGTAQIADAPGGGYGNDYIVSVAGMAPAENPQYVVLATFTKPTTLKTSFAAGPLFREVMTQVLQTYRVKPSTTPPTDIPDTW